MCDNEEQGKSSRLSSTSMLGGGLGRADSANMYFSSNLERTWAFISRIWPYLSTNGLKKYLFYLIEYYLIRYHGQSRIFGLTDEGLDLLRLIKLEKENSKKNIENFMIILK